MDQGTAQAISVIEKQMVDMNQKIAELDKKFGDWDASMSAKVAMIDRAVDAFMKELGK